jgi:hypothetical protein
MFRPRLICPAPITLRSGRSVSRIAQLHASKGGLTAKFAAGDDLAREGAEKHGGSAANPHLFRLAALVAAQ